MTNILVAGGAGYIGAHTCLDLFNKGFTPVVYDNLSNGHAEFVKWGALEIGDIRDRNKLDEVLRKYKPLAIIHFAAAIEVVARHLGNTPTVARNSYVHPDIVDLYVDGSLPDLWSERPTRDTRWLLAEERRLLRVLRAARRRQRRPEPGAVQQAA